jgi:hypothetical protein
VWASGRTRGPDAAQLVEHPVGWGI